MKYSYENYLVNKDEIRKIAESLFDYLDEIKEKAKNKNYNFFESFILLPDDEDNLKKIKNLAKNFSHFKNFILIGIGGSNLGTLAIYSCLNSKSNIIFAETFDSLKIKEILELIEREPNDVGIILVSKTGTTLESLANFFIILEKLKNIVQNLQEKVVVITDENSVLDKYAKENKLSVLNVPEKVGGRFSVFSAIGLFPLIVAGIDIDQILKSSKEITNICLEKDFEKNFALINASIIFYHLKNNLNIYNIFAFLPQLENLSLWYRQLISESLGKEGKGITPLISIGTRDLHSMYQLFLDGPKDKLTNFIYVENLDIDFTIQNVNLEGFEFLNNKTFNQLLKAVYQSVRKSYQEFNLPFVENIFENLDEKNLGEFMQSKMIEIIFLGKLLNINPFNQPAVENYKKNIKSFL